MVHNHEWTQEGGELCGSLVSLTVLARAPLCHQQNFDIAAATHCTGRWKGIDSKLFEKPIKNNDYDMKSTMVAYIG